MLAELYAPILEKYIGGSSIALPPGKQKDACED